MASVAEIEAEFLKVMPRYRWTADEAVARALQAGANLKGKHVIVTGATSGIGVPSALALAKTGCHLTVTARDAKKAGELEGQYKAVAEAAGGSARFAALDLTSYASVKAFAREWGQKPVEVLLHNAGVMAQPLTFTGDGEELQLHTNVLSVVLLTELLRPLLTDTARVVILSSGAHRRIPADVDFLGIFRYYLKGVHEDASKYEKWTSYATTKSLEIMYANALTEEFIAEGKGTRAVAVHPGVIPTGLATHLSEQELGMFAWKTADGSINPHFKTVEQGAATSVWACTSPELNGVGGVYLENCSVTPKDQISNGVPTWAAPDAKLVSGTKPHVWKLDDCRTVTSELRQHLASKGQL